jgi:hypothetical protein
VIAALSEIQFSLLPLGSLLLLVVLAVLWFRRRNLNLSEVAAILGLGALAGALVVVALHRLELLPWAMPCLDCLAANEWFSLALTLVQGWGFVSASVLAWVLVRRAGNERARGQDAA